MHCSLTDQDIRFRTEGIIWAAFLRPIRRLRLDACEARKVTYAVASEGVRLKPPPEGSLSL